MFSIVWVIAFFLGLFLIWRSKNLSVFQKLISSAGLLGICFVLVGASQSINSPSDAICFMWFILLFVGLLFIFRSKKMRFQKKLTVSICASFVCFALLGATLSILDSSDTNSKQTEQSMSNFTNEVASTSNEHIAATPTPKPTERAEPTSTPQITALPSPTVFMPVATPYNELTDIPRTADSEWIAIFDHQVYLQKGAATCIIGATKEEVGALLSAFNATETLSTSAGNLYSIRYDNENLFICVDFSDEWIASGVYVEANNFDTINTTTGEGSYLHEHLEEVVQLITGGKSIEVLKDIDYANSSGKKKYVMSIEVGNVHFSWKD